MITLFLSFCLGGWAGNNVRFNVNSLSVLDGMASNCVYCITQDEVGFIWIGTDVGVDRYDGKTFRHYSFSSGTDKSLSDPVVNCFLVTSDGNLLVGTEHGLNLYDYVHDEFRIYDGEGSLSKENIRVLVEQNEYLWIGTDNGLFRFNRTNGEIINYNTSNSGLVHDIVRTFHITDDYYFIGTFDGLSRLNRRTGQWTSVNLKPSKVNSPKNNLVLSMLQSPSDENILLVGTQTGYCKLDMETLEYVCHDKMTNPQIVNNTIKTMCLVGDDIWMGTEEGVMVDDGVNITCYGYEPSKINSLPSSIVWGIFEDSSNLIWMATEGGIAYLDIIFPDFQYIDLTGVTGSRYQDVTVFTAVATSANKIFTGSRFGLVEYDILEENIEYIPLSAEFDGTYNFIRGLTTSGDGLIWVGTAEGVMCYDLTTGTEIIVQPMMKEKLKYINAMSSKEKGVVYAINVYGSIHKICYDYDSSHKKMNILDDVVIDVGERLSNLVEDEDYVWCGTSSNKLIRYAKKDFMRKEIVAPGIIHSMCRDDINDILWIGCDCGFFRYDSSKNTFDKVTELDESVYAIVSDSKGYIWFTTKSSICTYDLLTDSLVMYPMSHWLRKSRQLISVATSYDDDVYLFGQDCILKTSHSMIPSDIKSSRLNVILSEMLVNGHDVVELDLCDRPLNEISRIVLSHNQNSLSFNFSMLDYSSPSQIYYEYCLEGYDTSVKFINGTTHYVEYSHLPPGQYTLRVSATSYSSRLSEGEMVLDIVIKSPWWATWWAICIYLIIAVSVSVLIIRFRRNHRKVEIELEKAKMEREKIEGLDKIKNQFFADISHDFRTPITLIISPIESLYQEEDNPEKRAKLEVVRKNAYRLLKLVNQILDLKKADSKTLHLNIGSHDIVSVIKDSCDTFAELAQKKHLSLSFESSENSLIMDFDRDNMEKVIVNLVSNAVKYTTDGGQVLVSFNRLSDSNVEITVADTGIGIPEEELPMIFERFYQVDASSDRRVHGSGLGLAIVKSLVELHGGTIDVKGQSQGTIFKVTLPVVNEQESSQYVSPADVSGVDERPDLMIVEDNNEMRSYLVSELSDHYCVRAFSDAESALTRIFDMQPDIVISDVMLPGMSGVELCRKIKEDLSLNHISVVLLSALTEEESIISGFKCGADEYIGKPFNMRILLTRIESLLIQKKALCENLKRDTIDLSTVDKASPDTQFIQKVISIIEENISDPDLDVPYFCDRLALSHISFYRKVKAITGYNVNNLIREIRLKKAAQLLRMKGYTVTEVMYDVGFNHRSYFSKCFKELFGMTPKEYAKQNQIDESHEYKHEN